MDLQAVVQTEHSNIWNMEKTMLSKDTYTVVINFDLE